MMNIVFLNEHFNMGGLERVSYVLGDNLSKSYNTYFYSMFSDVNYYNIKKNFIVGRSSKKISRWLDYRKYLKKIEYLFNKEITPSNYFKKELEFFIEWINSNDIDLVIISSPMLISCIDYLKNRSSCRYFAWIHNNYNTYMNNYTKDYNSSFIKGLNKSDSVVCLTSHDLKLYRKFNPKTFCIYNPLTISNDELSSLEVKNISFTSRVSFDHKGIDYLIEISKRIPNDWTITVAGNGNIEEVSLLLNEIKKNDLEKKLIFKGPLKDQLLIEHYKNSSIYLMTSRWEGMPLVLAEAMSFGLPIIAFDQSGSNEVLGNGKFGKLIPMGNLDDMEQAIREFCENPQVLKFYQEKSLQRVKDFNLEEITQIWTCLFEQTKI
ncbi:glycosyltransferase [Enterococcus casseliflavus]|uniref:glycosyltransferase n=1 Tax=Enterococcus casseliflavus TaxID=37734 RepID=UPI00177F42BC|nr:glycosyltransferase [Enterococcus casseliflavus]QOG30502.1 glycosyltransferase family 4 protein [Enterococcus casseliflavus]